MIIVSEKPHDSLLGVAEAFVVLILPQRKEADKASRSCLGYRDNAEEEKRKDLAILMTLHVGRI